MTGGPGCSSELAVFFENGPYNIVKDGEEGGYSLKETKYGWDRTHTTIFVDQPINTGFSWSEDDRDRCYDEKCVSDDMLDFMTELYKARPELQSLPFFVTGESYAGHYVPAVASRIFHAAKSGEVDVDINLQGLAIGNGLTAPAIQYGAYSDYALKNGLIGQGLHDRLKMLYPACRVALEVCDSLDFAIECLLAVEFCQMTQFAPIMLVNPGERRRCAAAGGRAAASCLWRPPPRMVPPSCNLLPDTWLPPPPTHTHTTPHHTPPHPTTHTHMRQA
jgi:hypothetical protein